MLQNTLKTIALPNKLRDPFIFEDVMSLQERIYGDCRSLDLSQISFIEPYSMIALLLLGRAYLRSRGERLRLVNIPLHIHQYFARMDFFQTGVFETSEKLGEALQLHRTGQSKRLIEIIEIPGKERESIKVISSVIALFRKRATHILKLWLSDNIVDYFVTVISELCQNIFEHSLDSGYLAMQAYTVGRENVFRLVISDSGIGIRKSFDGREGLTFESPAHLLEKAVFTPISSKREYGYGLCQVNTIVEKLNGTLFIRSEQASLTAWYQKKTRGAPFLFLKNDLVPFTGTQIAISLSA